MRYVPRLIEPELAKASRHFSALIITGPRRAGKTTLLRRAFPEADYRLLEDPEIVSRVRPDPGAFLEARIRAHIDIPGAALFVFRKG